MAAKSSDIQQFPFSKLPSELQIKIFSRYLSYDEISRSRLICRSINHICQQILNAGFHRVERFHARSLQRVKSQLPRRESERRTHELARHADILTSIETRLSLLSMTYGKFMDSSLCCFIPGKVLDEMFRVLRIVNNTPRGDQAPRPHELLQELRDISSMAMEHFEEHIVNGLRDRISMSPSAANNAAVASLSTSALVLYASASGSPPLLGVGLSALSKNAACAVSHHLHDVSDNCRRHRMTAGYSTTHSTSSADNQQHQNQRYEWLKRQFQSQRGELTVYKRELAHLRTTQQRQKEKLTEMERRLNEHEQNFIDVLAQLRSNGSISASNTGNVEVIINDDADQSLTLSRKRIGDDRSGSTAGAGVGKRKRIIQAAASSTSTPSNKGVAGSKRQKLDKIVGGSQ